MLRYKHDTPNHSPEHLADLYRFSRYTDEWFYKLSSFNIITYLDSPGGNKYKIKHGIPAVQIPGVYEKKNVMANIWKSALPLFNKKII